MSKKKEEEDFFFLDKCLMPAYKAYLKIVAYTMSSTNKTTQPYRVCPRSTATILLPIHFCIAQHIDCMVKDNSVETRCTESCLTFAGLIGFFFMWLNTEH